MPSLPLALPPAPAPALLPRRQGPRLLMHRSGLPADRVVPAILSCKRQATAMQRGALLTRLSSRGSTSSCSTSTPTGAGPATTTTTTPSSGTLVHTKSPWFLWPSFACYYVSWVGDSVHCASAIRSTACAGTRRQSMSLTSCTCCSSSSRSWSS